MRKNNDGYVIIYVIFVILFLCIVAIGTCSSALSNLKSQNEAVVQMQEKYAAEGEVEKFVSEVCLIQPVSYCNQADLYTLESTAIIVKNLFLSKIMELSTAYGIHIFKENVKWGNDYCQINLLSAAGNINAVVEFGVTITPTTVYKKDPETDKETNEPDSFTVTIEANNSQYLSYTTGGDAA